MLKRLKRWFRPTKEHPRRYVTEKGYVQLWWMEGRRRRHVWEHRQVWEQHHGKIKKGWEIHHKNGRRSDNRISNLRAMSHKAHKRLHAKYRRQKS